MICALWTAQTKGLAFRRPFVLPALAVVALVPAVWRPIYHAPLERRPFFTAGLYRSCIPEGETIAVFPFGWTGDSMLWQAESGFRFNLAEGYMSPIVFGAPPISKFQSDPTVSELTFSTGPLADDGHAARVRGRHRVGRFISVVSHGYPSAKQMRRFGPVERWAAFSSRPRAGSRR